MITADTRTHYQQKNVVFMKYSSHVDKQQEENGPEPVQLCKKQFLMHSRGRNAWHSFAMSSSHIRAGRCCFYWYNILLFVLLLWHTFVAILLSFNSHQYYYYYYYWTVDNRTVDQSASHTERETVFWRQHAILTRFPTGHWSKGVNAFFKLFSMFLLAFFYAIVCCAFCSRPQKSVLEENSRSRYWLVPRCAPITAM